MKKNLIILSSLLMIASVMYALPFFNTLNINRAFNYSRSYHYNNHASEAIEVSDLMHSNEVTSVEYSKIINDAAINHDLVLYILMFRTEEKVNTNSVYLTTNDIYLKDWLLLDGGYADKIDKDIVYSSTAELKEFRITTFNLSHVIEVTSIENYPFEAGYYNIYNLKGDFQVNIDNFIDEVRSKLGEFTFVQSNLHFSSFNSDFYYMGNLLNNLGNKMMIALVLMLMLCSKMFSFAKKVSVFKVEGHSTLKIYSTLFLKDFIISLILVFIGATFITFMMYGSNILTFMCLIQLIGIQYIQMMALTLVLSSLVYLIIKYMPIMVSIKGKSKMQEIQSLAYGTKVVVIFLILPLVMPLFNDVRSYLIIQSRQDEVSERFANWYDFGFYKTSHKYNADMGSDQYIALKQYLVENNQLHSFGMGFHIEDFQTFDPLNKDVYYVIDENFIRNNELLEDESLLRDLCVFTFENTLDSEEQIKKKMLSYVRNPDEATVHFIKLKRGIHSLSFEDLLFTDHVNESLYLGYVPIEQGLEGQLNSDMFYYQGTTQQAQVFMDQLFHDFGYVGAYRINSVQSSFMAFSEIMKGFYAKGFVSFILLIIACFISNQFLVDTDIDHNKRRYALAAVEGVNPYTFYVYLLKIASSSFVAMTLCILSKRLLFDESILYAIGLIVVMESLFYGIYIRKSRKIGRGTT